MAIAKNKQRGKYTLPNTTVEKLELLVKRQKRTDQGITKSKYIEQLIEADYQVRAAFENLKVE